MQASMYACYVLVCTGPYLSQIGMDQRDQCIYGIRRKGPTFLSIYFTLSMQARMHAPYVLVYTGQYLSQIALDQRDQSIYGIRRTCRTIWVKNLTQSHKLVCMHTISLRASAHISANLVGPEWWRYLWNQENMLDHSEHIIWPEQAGLHTCTLCFCMLGPISQPNWVGT